MSSKEIKKLPDAEFEIMRAIWRCSEPFADPYRETPARSSREGLEAADRHDDAGPTRKESISPVGEKW